MFETLSTQAVVTMRRIRALAFGSWMISFLLSTLAFVAVALASVYLAVRYPVKQFASQPPVQITPTFSLSSQSLKPEDVLPKQAADVKPSWYTDELQSQMRSHNHGETVGSSSIVVPADDHWLREWQRRGR